MCHLRARRGSLARDEKRRWTERIALLLVLVYPCVPQWAPRIAYSPFRLMWFFFKKNAKHRLATLGGAEYTAGKTTGPMIPAHSDNLFVRTA